MLLNKLKKFYRPFIITYIFFSVVISFYPSFDFYSLKGQLIIIFVSIFNGVLGTFIKKL
jgi:pilus assembly protein TadC